MNRTAQVPPKAYTSITISWGMLNIPLGVYSGTQETRVDRKEFLDGDSEVSIGRCAIRKDTGAVVDNEAVTRMAQANNGAWVILTDEEIADSTSPKGLAQVETFVSLKDTEQFLANGLVQVRPKREKGKANPAAEKAFALLLAAMSKRKVAALIKVAMRGPAKYGLLFPNGDLRFVHTADALRQELPLPATQLSKAEVAVALQLIDTVGIDTPLLTDDTAPVVQAFVDAKAAGKPAPKVDTAPAIGGDIMATLEASIAAAKSKKGKAA